VWQQRADSKEGMGGRGWQQGEWGQHGVGGSKGGGSRRVLVDQQEGWQGARGDRLLQQGVSVRCSNCGCVRQQGAPQNRQQSVPGSDTCGVWRVLYSQQKSSLCHHPGTLQSMLKNIFLLPGTHAKHTAHTK
jgi:hypothetical protein